MYANIAAAGSYRSTARNLSRSIDDIAFLTNQMCRRSESAPKLSLSLHVSISRIDWWEHTSQINCSYREDTPHGNSSANTAGIAPRLAFPEKLGMCVSRETRMPSRYSNLLDETGLMTLRRSIYPSAQS